MTPARPRLPSWLRGGALHTETVIRLQNNLRRHRLHTVCESARCPNIHDCFHRGTATFMILGNLCTRGCRFCAVPKGSPDKQAFSLDPGEPASIARMAHQMALRYVVITSVARDDLPDGGAGHFAETVNQIRTTLPKAGIEVLVPDFRGEPAAVAGVLDSGPDVFNHNIETVPRLYGRVRPQACYHRSLDVLRLAKRHSPDTITKSGLMVGLGEDATEVESVLADLKDAGVDVVTIGQYLQPTLRNLPVAEYVTPEQFKEYRAHGLALGLREVFSGPRVRSSYGAEHLWHNL